MVCLLHYNLLGVTQRQSWLILHNSDITLFSWHMWLRFFVRWLYILAVVHTPPLCVYQSLLKCPVCSGNLCQLFCFDLGFPSPESVLYFGKHIIWMHQNFGRMWYPEKLSLGLNKQKCLLRGPVVDVFQTSHCGFQWAFTGVRVKSLQPCNDSSKTNSNDAIYSPLMMFDMLLSVETCSVWFNLLINGRKNEGLNIKADENLSLCLSWIEGVVPAGLSPHSFVFIRFL